MIEDSFNPKNVDHENDRYDVLITIDFLAEGINLHRSNALINYDLPWNPSRIMQRVGRINRVGTEFDQIYVFNFYLAGKTGSPDDDIRKFILYGEYFRDTDTQKTLRVQDEKTGKVHYEFDRNKEMEIPASILSYQDNVNRLQELDTLLENVKIAE